MAKIPSSPSFLFLNSSLAQPTPPHPSFLLPRRPTPPLPPPLPQSPPHVSSSYSLRSCLNLVDVLACAYRINYTTFVPPEHDDAQPLLPPPSSPSTASITPKIQPLSQDLANGAQLRIQRSEPSPQSQIGASGAIKLEPFDAGPARERDSRCKLRIGERERGWTVRYRRLYLCTASGAGRRGRRKEGGAAATREMEEEAWGRRLRQGRRKRRCGAAAVREEED